MPLALLAALGASLAVHAAALFLPDVDLSLAPEPPLLQVELPPPAPPASVNKPVAKPKAPTIKTPKRRVALPKAESTASESGAAAPVAESGDAESAVAADKAEPEQEAPPAANAPPAAVEPKLEAEGSIRFAVYSVPLAPDAALFDTPAPAQPSTMRGMEIGRAEHTWHFADGTYRLQSTMETSGVVALFKSYRIVFESSGRLTAGGLQPERFSTKRNGKETDERAVFDWSQHTVTLRDGKVRPASEGAQDVLSLHYQLAYVPNLAAGTSMEVATGKKYDRYRFEAVGEETVETPSGNYRTLHVRVKTDSTTDLWLAQERQLLPVKIRYTDRKGEAFELQAVAIGKAKP